MKEKKSLILSLVGLALALVGLFLPWFNNTKMTVTGITAVQNFGPVLVCLVYVLFVASAILAFIVHVEKERASKINVAIRVFAAVLALYFIMGVRKLMVFGPEGLPVETLWGAYVVVVGAVAQLLAALITYKTILGQKRWSTVDLVLTVIVAAIYAAALLTLSFIKLAPGTWLRPANAMQAPFGILFGIPGCLGIAIGNFISDLTQGTAPHVMIMGFITNFLTAFIPYIVVSKAKLSTKRSLIEFVIFGSFLGSLIVAGSIFINVMFGLTPKAVAVAFFPTTFLNQLLPSLLLGIPLCRLLYPFVMRAGLYRGKDSAREDFESSKK